MRNQARAARQRWGTMWPPMPQSMMKCLPRTSGRGRAFWTPLPLCGLAAPPMYIPCALPARTSPAVLSWQIALEDGHLLVRRYVLERCRMRSAARRERAAPLERRRIVDRRASAAGIPSAYDSRGRGGTHRARSSSFRTRATCPGNASARRIWALATQLYALRSRNDWGIGDFTSLKRLVTLTAAAGRSRAIGAQPAPRAASRPILRTCSPYAPSSRLFLNALYLDVAAVPGSGGVAATRGPGSSRPSFTQDAALAARAGIRRLSHGVAALKHERPAAALHVVLRQPLGTSRRRARRSLSPVRPRARTSRSSGWRSMRRSTNTFVPRRSRGTGGSNGRSNIARRILRTCGDSRGSIARASTSTATCNGWPTNSSRRPPRTPVSCGVGLYRDLAVGVDLNGADAWGDQRTIRRGSLVRRAPRCPQPRRSELGPAALLFSRAAPARVRTVRRAAARQHAPRERSCGSIT